MRNVNNPPSRPTPQHVNAGINAFKKMATSDTLQSRRWTPPRANERKPCNTWTASQVLLHYEEERHLIHGCQAGHPRARFQNPHAMINHCTNRLGSESSLPQRWRINSSKFLKPIR